MSLSAQAEIPAATIVRSSAATDRLAFVDNVRWVMILLVLYMHAAVTYSPFGGWYYRERTQAGLATLFFFGTSQAFLQGFFMALLFFVAGYFVPRSDDRKGAAAFVAGRLIRLGLPTLLFVALIGPVTEYYLAHSWHTDASFPQALAVYVTRWRFLGGTGPLWFCAALLIFSLCYVAWRQLVPAPVPASHPRLPSAFGVVLTIAAIAVASFAIRIWLPVGTAIYNMQLCYFASYVVMFALGIAAANGRWLERVSDRFAVTAAAACVTIAVLAWPPFLAYGGALEGHTAAYNGGVHWQSAVSSLWEALVCVGMSFAILASFRTFYAGQGSFARFMSRNAFAVYVVHPPILVILAVALSGYAAPPVAKCLLLWLLGTLLCFGLAAPLARRLPLIGRIL
jgi:glucan biosynthesis protein C